MIVCVILWKLFLVPGTLMKEISMFRKLNRVSTLSGKPVKSLKYLEFFFAPEFIPWKYGLQNDGHDTAKWKIPSSWF